MWYKNKNFKNLILGKSALNIGDSFYLIAISIGLVLVYNASAAELSIFALCGMMPRLLAFTYGSYIDKVKDKRKAIVNMQITHIILVILISLTFYFSLNMYIAYVLNIIFYLVNTIETSLQVSFVPETLDYSEELINKSVDIQYFTTNTLDIISNFVASVLLGVISYLAVFNLSIPFLIAGVYFFTKISIDKMANKELESQDDEEISEQQEGTKELLLYFSKQKKPSFIIFSEAFLSGAIDMLLVLVPLYLVLINVDVKWLGLVVALRRGADFLGAVLAPYVKMDTMKFFFLDYILTGSMLALIFIVDNIYLKLVFYFVSFVIIGISGNFFEKMIYKYYDVNKLAGVHSIVNSMYAFFGIVFLIVPIFYSNIVILGILFNLLSIVFGVVVLFFRKDKTISEEK